MQQGRVILLTKLYRSSEQLARIIFFRSLGFLSKALLSVVPDSFSSYLRTASKILPEKRVMFTNCDILSNWYSGNPTSIAEQQLSHVSLSHFMLTTRHSVGISSVHICWISTHMAFTTRLLLPCNNSAGSWIFRLFIAVSISCGESRSCPVTTICDIA